MNRPRNIWFRHLSVAGLILVVLAASSAMARDAAFLDPGNGSGANADDAVKVEPKSEIDIGESVLNVPRRTTLFFVNETNAAIQVEKTTVNGDGNVSAEITADDCAKQGTLTAQSRCSVEVSVTPTSPGAWSVVALMKHNGAGSVARAKLSGKTSGSTASTERKDTGLALNSKDNKPVEFGDVEVGSGKAVRSALMINDSPDPITIYSIDVIEADNGLTRLDQGCAVDMELKPGESCPVTLVWAPQNGGQISTDLIIRHSGRLGFAVIPIRGAAKLPVVSKDDKSDGKTGTKDSRASSTGIPAPPSADDLARVTFGKIPTVSSTTLGGDAGSSSGGSGTFHLIGTVGNRVVLLKPDGTTAVADAGDEINVGDDKAKVLTVSAKSAEIMYLGKKRTLQLANAPELMARSKSLSDNSEHAEHGSSAPSLMPSSSTPLPTSAANPLPTQGAAK